MISEESIKESLKDIKDPVTGKSLTELGFIKDIKYNSGVLTLSANLTDPHNSDNVKNEIESAVKAKHSEIKTVNIIFTLGVISHNNERKEQLMPGVKNTISVASGKGGVGKSTVTVNLAAALALEGAKVGIIDADIYGPSIPLMLGVNTRPRVINLEGKNKMMPIVKHGIKLMSIGFLMEEGTAVVWRGPMASSALKQFMGDVVWDELDYLLFDMPPGTGDIQLTLSQSVPLTGSVIVTTPQEISLADARKGVIMFQKLNVPVFGIIENMSYFTNSDGKKEHIFGHGGGKKMSEEFGVRLLSEIPINTKIRESGDEGIPVVLKDTDMEESQAFVKAAREIIKEINIRNLTAVPTPNVEIKL